MTGEIPGVTREQTVNCDIGQDDFCDGYIDPRTYGAQRPCGCTCHEYRNPRNLEAALRDASEVAPGA